MITGKRGGGGGCEGVVVVGGVCEGVESQKDGWYRCCDSGFNYLFCYHFPQKNGTYQSYSGVFTSSFSFMNIYMEICAKNCMWNYLSVLY